jgi:diguanylate cyclase (GGDEF)-like protein
MKRRTLATRLLVISVLVTVFNLVIFSVLVFENQSDLVVEVNRYRMDEAAGEMIRKVTKIAGEIDPGTAPRDLVNAFAADGVTLILIDTASLVTMPSNRSVDPALFLEKSLKAITARDLSGTEWSVFLEDRFTYGVYVPLDMPDGLADGHDALAYVTHATGFAEFLRTMSRVFMIVILLVTAMHFFYAFYLYRAVIRPLRRLSRHAIDIIAGRYANRVEVRTGDEIGRLANSLNVMADVIEQKILNLNSEIAVRQQTEEQLREITLTDELTGIGNRKLLDDKLRELIALARRYDTHFSFILLDIDYFKKINDVHGHQVGDTVLTEVATLCSIMVRDSDTACRWGGEEFAILLPSTPVAGAMILAERIRTRIADNLFNGSIAVTVSMGVTSYMLDDTPESIFERADRALYRAKESGRNQVESG